jgi:hypothetical protein
MTRLVFIAAMAALGGCAVLSNVTPIGNAVDVIKVDAPAPPFGRPPSAEVDFRCKAASQAPNAPG